MKRSMQALILLISFSLTACETVPQTEPLRPDLDYPHRMICEPVPARVALPEAYRIDWSQVTTVTQARVEHEKAVASIYQRNGLVAAHLLLVEERLFVCSNNMQWWRDYWSEMPNN